MEIQETIRCCIMRGGTSRAVFFLRNDLPKDEALRDRIIMRVMGAPDLREIDGLGGADLLTSKVAIIGPPTRKDCDVDYLFGQVELKDPLINYNTNCGNISSAVGPFAIDEGLIDATEPVTTVRIHQVNMNMVLVAEVPVKGNRALVEGIYRIDGVPGTGARIDVDFSNCGGAMTGSLLPTGNVTDVLHIEGQGDLDVSIIDTAPVTVHVRAQDLDLSGTETPQELMKDTKLLDRVEMIRACAAQKVHFIKGLILPTLIVCGLPQSYRDWTTGRQIDGADIDLCAKGMSSRQVHKAFAGTGAISLMAAAMIPGTVANQLARSSAIQKSEVRIGHPSGIMAVEGKVGRKNGTYVLERAILGRTARCIMKGRAFIPKSCLSSS